MIATLSTEYTRRWDMHQSLFYQVACGVFPFFLVSAARASSARWPATLVAAVYTAITLLMLWILPLFEGRPLLGPIYVQLDRFLPPDPPLLLIAPALAIDLLMRAFGARLATGGWRRARRRVPRRSSRRAVAVRRLPDVPVGAQLDLRDPSHGLHGVRRRPRRAGIELNPPDNLRLRACDRARARVRLGAVRIVVGQLDVPGAAMSR